ncbi:MAG TPA: galactokinase family protein [Vicinamibacteria bacterium]|nr:galactokinase family protein [Vicinamibacteria bacterium]
MRVLSGATRGLPDAQRFLETLAALPASPVPEARGLFAPGAEVVVARAPGRLDVMGGIADYSGSLVLELPIREATFAAVQRDPERTLRIVSLPGAAGDRAAAFEMPLARFGAGGELATYADAQAYFRSDPSTRWAAYAAGVFLVLMRERGAAFEEGARLLVASDVPEGKGVSSSAALEVAVMTAVAGAFGVAIEPREAAILCQKVENLVVGAPCGVMDQMTSVCGEPDRLLALLCQPAELQGHVALPEDLTVFGIDSGIRHAVSGADYGSVRVGAFMGYRILAEEAGLAVKRAPAGARVAIEDPRWHGCLANLTPSEFEPLAPRLPDRIEGEEFLARYGGTTDPVTRVDPEREYAVRQPTAHPVYEHLRVRAFASLLEGPPGERRRELLGELMYQSHASYSACGLGSSGTDRLVGLVRQAGTAEGLYGAKITGGGSGGTVAVLGRRGPRAEDAVARIAEHYAAETGHAVKLFSGSSPGAASFGLLRQA